MKSEEQILDELKAASTGLLWMSESDYPFETIYIKSEKEPPLRTLRELARADGRAQVETRSLEEFFRIDTSGSEWERMKKLPLTPGVAAIVRTLKENLTDLCVYRIGEINIPVFIIGRSAKGNWIGLTTRVVET
jgi:hypothetical protein